MNYNTVTPFSWKKLIPTITNAYNTSKNTNIYIPQTNSFLTLDLTPFESLEDALYYSRGKIIYYLSRVKGLKYYGTGNISVNQPFLDNNGRRSNTIYANSIFFQNYLLNNNINGKINFESIIL